MSDKQYPTSARVMARARAGISDVGYRYRTSGIYIGRPIYIYQTSDIYIGRPICILDIRYRFQKDWWHLVLNGAS